MQIVEFRQISNEKFLLGFSDGSELRVAASVASDMSLRRGLELEDAEMDALRSAAALASAKERALRLIGLRPMSVRELEKKLVEKGETPENAAACSRWLTDLHLMDDEQYAGMVARHYFGKGYGAGRVRDELFRRGVPKQFWDAAIAETDAPEGRIDKLLRSRLKSENPDRAEIKRASDALYRRGYSWDEIKSAVERYMEGQNDL